MTAGAIADSVTVVGAGLAGCEVAWQLARRGVSVVLYEARPGWTSPAHETEDFAELVCSNSLRASRPTHAVGLLKNEMRRLGSLVLEAADACAVPAGRALAVERGAFARTMTERIEAEPRIEVRREALDELPEEPLAVLATGPLTAPPLAAALGALLGEEHLYFYDAIAPIVYADSIDHDIAFRASRWEDGEGDYLNLPLDRAGYEAFVAALVAADTLPLHGHEARLYFEGCLPVEEMARRGRDTLAFGPMKPVGLRDPRTREQPHAVVQLRQEDKRGVLYNLVGFQTRLRIGDQKEVLRSLPGLADAVFARFGSVHRNTYVNAPAQLRSPLEVRARPGLYVTGQLAGVEGYVESAALGLLTGIHLAARAQGRVSAPPPPETAHAALLRHLSEADPRHFQPMNVNFGLFPPLPRTGRKIPKREKQEQLAARAQAALEPWAAEVSP
ncbi:MAG: methylenetetrahydrofolate--tRNA-(uracil(54)-C(5))-methyltransferase (FADH(2)-oxidizing) TrmFO [Myxococcota bacterium]